jgi:aromatic-L-amino-acid decarboxylase
LLTDLSTFNAHPRFFGYITAGAAPIGVLGDLLAAGINPNVGAWSLSPLATEIERQTIAWIAELLGYPTDCGGLFVSGGNMANITACIVARTAKAPWNVSERGVEPPSGVGRLVMYGSKETHTWIKKAADMCGLGTQAIRWLETRDDGSVDISALRRAIARDRANGDVPFMVVGTAGTVSTGAIDSLTEIAAICREGNIWFHADGAYGATAAVLPEAPAELAALRLADSVVMDPHKWLYAPLEAGVVLVRDAEMLRKTFSFGAPYYHFEGDPGDPPTNFYELGPQNSRGFRALKVWLGLQHAGRAGYVQMIRDDIALAKAMYDRASSIAELEVGSLGLSIATFRYVPNEMRRPADSERSVEDDTYLDRLNSLLLSRMQAAGRAYLSNAIIRGRFFLRACIVNFRTTLDDALMIPDLVVDIGRSVHAELRDVRQPSR